MDVPVTFIPDKDFLKAKNAMLHTNYASGTKTLDALSLDEAIRKNKQDATLDALKLEESKRQANMDNEYKRASLDEMIRANNLDSTYKNQTLQASIASAQQQSVAAQQQAIAEANKPAKMNNSQKASGYIQRNATKFKTPNDMYHQVLRNMKAGTVEYDLGNTILSQLKALYPEKIELDY